MICDAEGVPNFVQSIKYCYSEMAFDVHLFDGRHLIVPSDFACPSIDLFDSPTRMQFLEAENRIERFFLRAR